MCVSFWFLVIFSHVNQWQSVKWANKYKILILNSHFRLRKLRLSYQGTKNVAIYAFFRVKFKKVGNLTDVKLLTNSISAHWAQPFLRNIIFELKMDFSLLRIWCLFRFDSVPIKAVACLLVAEKALSFQFNLWKLRIAWWHCACVQLAEKAKTIMWIWSKVSTTYI